ncbi:hypothetical protein ACHAWF_002871 [Thalassiosira exigua]
MPPPLPPSSPPYDNPLRLLPSPRSRRVRVRGLAPPFPRASTPSRRTRDGARDRDAGEDDERNHRARRAERPLRARLLSPSFAAAPPLPCAGDSFQSGGGKLTMCFFLPVRGRSRGPSAISNLVDDATFVPTPENARELESWNQNFGHVPTACTKFVDGAPAFVRMAQCATNCHVQWFGGLSCPWWDPPLRPGPDARPIRREVPIEVQYRAARDKLFEYNFIVIMEKLKDPTYVAAVEEFFGVPGIARRGRHAWCELESHYANEWMPLAIQNETMRELTRRNAADVALYRELGGCLDRRGDTTSRPGMLVASRRTRREG